MSNLNMPVKYCKDENDEEFSPVVYQESMFNDDGTRMDPVPRKMFAKAYDPTKTYPTENLFCIQDNKYYKFTGSGTTTGTFDPTKWTETDDATELTALNSTLTTKTKYEILYYNSITSDLNVTITQSNTETWVRRFGNYVDFRVAVKLNEAYSAWDANRSIIKLPFSNHVYMVTTFFVNNTPVKGAYLTPTNACGVQLGTSYASGTTLTIEGHFIFNN